MTPTGAGQQPADGGPNASELPPGPFVLQPLFEDVPLSEDGAPSDVKINCVDYFDGHLYVGTSGSELLHFFQIPPDPADPSGKPVYIEASRLRPAYSETPGAMAGSRRGVQQILLLPRVGKACILCNSTVTFYSLPELSPVFGPAQVKNCNWIGGVDLNEPLVDDGSGSLGSGVAIMLSLNRRIQVVRIGDEPRVFKKIDFAGSTLSVRRDNIACVADSTSYALLDVDRQLKIPLMSISSVDESVSPRGAGQAQSISDEAGGGISRSASSAQNRPLINAQSHSRSASLGGSFLNNMRRQEPRGGDTEDPTFQDASPRSASPQLPSEAALAPPPGDKPLPDTPSRTTTPNPPFDSKPKPGSVFLKPHIASPTPEEFLVVIGTSPVEPGIGMFVNLDGDPTRPTLKFERYPKEVVVDGATSDLNSSRSGLPESEDGYVLASLARELDDGLQHGIEIQRLDAGSEANPQKHWLVADGADRSIMYGIRSLTGSEETQFDDIVAKLCLRKYSPFFGTMESSAVSLKSVDSRTALSMERLSKEKELFERDSDSQDDDPLPEGWEATRNAEGEEFAKRLAKTQARLAVWSGNRIWWAVRNPLLIQSDAALDATFSAEFANPQDVDRQAMSATMESIRGRDPKTELEFMTFSYIRQKTGVLLLTNLLALPEKQQFSDSEINALEGVLVESGLDARVILSLVPGVRNEIVDGRRGIWIYGGVKQVAQGYLQSNHFRKTVGGIAGDLDPRVLHFLRCFLTSWRKRKGFGSVADEHEVFKSVDAALLLVLLELDQQSPTGSGGAVRSELNDLVDHGVDCFERAVDLLESYHRLFVLSRLYQSRKMSADVLATWRRIMEGERDDGQEIGDGELRVREYLTKVSHQALVQEYGVWLAKRNPKLGVQVFAEDKGKAPKFEPAQVLDILRVEAPDAVKYYLEHLVFGKGHTVYVNDLITYYLDVVVDHLQSSEAGRETIMATYDTYRALEAPKPTYRHFLEDNAPRDDEVWQSRLRLLQLLSGSHSYNAVTIHERIASLPGDLLVPETIILAGREHKHEDALRLLVHKLGDYDTAISYCLRGGSSTDVGPDGRLRDSNGEGDGAVPTAEEQRQLFRAVLREFLAVDDVSDRIEQTGALLERFGGWFEVDDVLSQIPDTWSVDIVAEFLVSALRRLVREKRESMMARALSGAENVRISYDRVLRIDEKGPSIEAPT